MCVVYGPDYVNMVQWMRSDLLMFKCILGYGTMDDYVDLLM